jgi:hypothetical protein
MPGVNLPQVGMNYVPGAIGTANIGMPGVNLPQVGMNYVPGAIGMPGVNLPQVGMNYVPGVVQWGEPRPLPFPEPGQSVYSSQIDPSALGETVQWGPERVLTIPLPIPVLPGSEAAAFGTGLN